MRAGELRGILRGRNFRRLYATRLTSQLTDGLFQVALAGYVFFSPERQTTAARAAAAFAVTLLPYSVLGPFAGVFIDRWRRRQILLWTPILRALVVLAVAALVAAGRDGAGFFLGVLVVLGVNRFFLAALSAALPHVVRRAELVTANAFAVTSGTVIAFAGAGLGYLLRGVFGAGTGGTALLLVASAGLFTAAGLIATSLPVRLLGPDPSGDPHRPDADPGTREAVDAVRIGSSEAAPQGPRDAVQREAAGEAGRTGRGPRDPAEATDPEPRPGAGAAGRPGAREVVVSVLGGLADGARHVARRPQAALALAAIAFHRFLYGVVLIMTLLLCRNHFAGDADAGLAAFALMLGVAGAGFFAAALVTPVVVRRIGKLAWIAALLGAAAVVLLVCGPPFARPAWAAASFVLGLVSQGVKLCVDTTLQESIDDAYRGRVFAVYDMLFNAAFAAAAAAAATWLPADGRSPVTLGALIAAYAAGAAGYRIAASRAGGARPAPGAP